MKEKLWIQEKKKRLLKVHYIFIVINSSKFYAKFVLITQITLKDCFRRFTISMQTYHRLWIILWSWWRDKLKSGLLKRLHSNLVYFFASVDSVEFHPKSYISILINGGIGPKASLNLGDSSFVLAGRAQVT